jgi:CubicO group peptidase (beta-lactamase class C family)
MEGAALGRVFARLFSEEELPTAVSLLVVRHGVLVAEGYARDPEDVDRARPLQSATKSVTSLLVGIARDRGLFADVDAPLADFLPDRFDADARKRAITLRHLLTMRSGLDYGNDVFSLEMEHAVEGDPLAFLLGRPLAWEPGTRFNYQDTDPHLVAGAVAARAGVSLEAFAREHLFAPLGIAPERWLADRAGNTYGPFGVFLTPRQLARLGQLVLQRGVWEGRRVVSEAWLAESTGVQVALAGSGAPTDTSADYGYYWWVDAARGVFYASGHGGQFLLVSPADALVVVMTAEPDTKHLRASVTPAQFLSLVDGIRAAVRGP